MKLAWDVIQVTELRNGCVYKTCVIKTIHLDPRETGYGDDVIKTQIAIEHGGDYLQANLKAAETE